MIAVLKKQNLKKKMLFIFVYGALSKTKKKQKKIKKKQKIKKNNKLKC